MRDWFELMQEAVELKWNQQLWSWDLTINLFLHDKLNSDEWLTNRPLRNVFVCRFSHNTGFYRSIHIFYFYSTRSLSTLRPLMFTSFEELTQARNGASAIRFYLNPIPSLSRTHHILIILPTYTERIYLHKICSRQQSNWCTFTFMGIKIIVMWSRL